jgi:hypothetical protein
MAARLVNGAMAGWGGRSCAMAAGRYIGGDSIAS